MNTRKGSNKATGRDYSYDRKYLKDHAEENAARKRARRAVEKKVGKAAVKGKDVDHVVPLKRGGSNATGNLRVTTVAKNRGRK